MGNYGDHSFDHDHGPGGYWEGREHLRPAGYDQPYQYQQVSSEPRLTPWQQIERDMHIAEYRRKRREQAEAKIAAMSDDQLVKYLIQGFDADFLSFSPDNGGVRSNLPMDEYRAIRLRFLGQAEPKRGT